MGARQSVGPAHLERGPLFLKRKILSLPAQHAGFNRQRGLTGGGDQAWPGLASTSRNAGSGKSAVT